MLRINLLLKKSIQNLEVSLFFQFLTIVELLELSYLLSEIKQFFQRDAILLLNVDLQAL